MAQTPHDEQASGEMAQTSSDKVTLDVSGRKFITLASTFAESDFFRTLFNEHWAHNRQADGSYFIDANPDTFEDVLEYLRRGWFPLFWDRETGHDFGRYKRLQQDAEYYKIPRLAKWLRKQCFLHAVTYNRRIYNRLLHDNQDRSIPNTSGSIVKQQVKMEWTMRRLWACPRLFHGQYHHPPTLHSRFDRCGVPLCETQRFSSANINRSNSWMDQQTLTAAVFEETAEINMAVCQPDSLS